MQSRLTLALAAAFWLAAGPGGLLLRQALACRDSMGMSMPHGAHSHQLPHGGGPCLCAQMVGSFDQVVSIAVPALTTNGVRPAPMAALASPPPLPHPASPAFTPETPPPIRV